MFEIKEKKIWAGLRISLGLIFFWAFIDKVFGLGFATAPEKSWLNGGSPTAGFLEFGTHGPFESIFQAMAGSVIVDWLFMIGLALIGLSLILGIGIKIAGYSGSVLMILMWLCVMPPEHNPLLDEHIIYLLVLLGLTTTDSGRYIGFGAWWEDTELVKKYKILK
jgi:thiosulfate dehydrogenase (quinone) large subunit